MEVAVLAMGILGFASISRNTAEGAERRANRLVVDRMLEALAG